MSSQLKMAAFVIIALWADSVSPLAVADQNHIPVIDNHIGNEASLRSIDQRLHSLEVHVKAIDQYLKNEFEVLKQYLSANISKPKVQLIEPRQNHETEQPVATPSLPEIECPSGFQSLPGTGSCYLVVSDPLPWSTGVERCQQAHAGAYAAVITSAQEQVAVTKFLHLKFLDNKNDPPAEESSGDLPIEDFFNPHDYYFDSPIFRRFHLGHIRRSRSLPVGKSTTTTTRREWGNLIWIGGQRTADRCDAPFVWKPTADKTLPMEFTNWNKNEPNCYDEKEYCIHLEPDRLFQWNDRNCNQSLITLCEFGPM